MKAKHAVGVMGVAVALATAGATALETRNEHHQRTAASARDRNVEIMLGLFRAIEQRDPHRSNIEQELAFYQPDVEFHWPPALPYGGTFRGVTQRRANNWSTTWTRLQPTAAERKMDPRVIGADDHQVVILYHQRGVSAAGERFDGEVIGLYELRDFKLSRAQMFYFDEAAVRDFLERAATPPPPPSLPRAHGHL